MLYEIRQLVGNIMGIGGFLAVIGALIGWLVN